ncbi:hypothetical protein [Qipengyuania mesophila]|uniref:hypothetical protein n=1 Tax=Qipengyuania mesophila TaxID=2867246 RepID=UPI003515252C
MKRCAVGLLAVAFVAGSGLVASASARAQSVAAEGAAATAEMPREPAAMETPAERIVVEKLTPVVIEILEPLGSKTSKSLDSYRIRLAEPIVVDGTEVVPAGAEGMGEVVHAKKAGGMGAAGELVLAARYLTVDGRELKLRSMELLETAEGKDRMGTVHALNVASAASPIPIGLIGYFIGGGNIEIPAGALASAKLAAPFEIAPATEVAAMTPAHELSAPEGGTDETEEGLQ